MKNKPDKTPELRQRLSNLPLNWSDLSRTMSGHPRVIRNTGTHPIPYKYQPKLEELCEILEAWKNSII